MTAGNKVRIALIGFGEAGTTFARGFAASGRHDLVTYDLLLATDAAMRDRAAAIGVEAAASAEAAMAGAAVVVSAVTASSAPDVAKQAGQYLKPGQFFLDINSVSPETKRHDEALVAPSGADYVEAAVMAPVNPLGIKVPILLGGRNAAGLKALLDPSGMNLAVADSRVGRASAIKMCRSIFIKGIEALMCECMLTARAYGVEDRILASLAQTYPGVDWEQQAGYLVMRVVEHGRRRAAEMREVADTIRETGLAPLMALATAERQDWIADLSAADPELKAAAEPAWRATIDRLSAAAGLRKADGRKAAAE